MYEIWIIIFLFICTVIDIKKQEVYMGICVINFLVALGTKFLMGDFMIADFIIVIFVGIAILLINIFTKGAIGLGDAYIIFSLAPLVSAGQLVIMLALAFMLCALFSAGGLLIKKFSINTKIPFVPFMFLGGIAGILMEKTNG